MLCNVASSTNRSAFILNMCSRYFNVNVPKSSDLAGIDRNRSYFTVTVDSTVPLTEGLLVEKSRLILLALYTNTLKTNVL